MFLVKKCTENEKFLAFSTRFNKNIAFFGIFCSLLVRSGAERRGAEPSKSEQNFCIWSGYRTGAVRASIFGKQRRDMDVHFCAQKFRIWGFRTELGPRRWIAGRSQNDILFNPGRIIYYILFYINK